MFNQSSRNYLQIHFSKLFSSFEHLSHTKNDQSNTKHKMPWTKTFPDFCNSQSLGLPNWIIWLLVVKLRRVTNVFIAMRASRWKFPSTLQASLNSPPPIFCYKEPSNGLNVVYYLNCFGIFWKINQSESVFFFLSCLFTTGRRKLNLLFCEIILTKLETSVDVKSEKMIRYRTKACE